MEKSNVSEVVLGMLVKQLNKKPEDVTPAMRIKEDLRADSLDIVEVLMSIEDKFGFTVPDEVVMNVKTVGDLMKVAAELAEKNK